METVGIVLATLAVIAALGVAFSVLCAFVTAAYSH